MTTRTREQRQLKTATWIENGASYRLEAEIRHDDSCGNGHNTFAITADLYRNNTLEACGCLHDEIIEHLPELVPFLKWHLTSTDSPMHYIANAKYHYGVGKYARRNDEYFKSTICAGALPDDESICECYLVDSDDDRKKLWPHLEKRLSNRLDRLMDAFRADVEQLGLEY